MIRFTSTPWRRATYRLLFVGLWAAGWPMSHMQLPLVTWALLAGLVPQ